jgi:hypothetical protein
MLRNPLPNFHFRFRGEAGCQPFPLAKGCDGISPCGQAPTHDEKAETRAAFSASTKGSGAVVCSLPPCGHRFFGFSFSLAHEEIVSSGVCVTPRQNENQAWPDLMQLQFAACASCGNEVKRGPYGTGAVRVPYGGVRFIFWGAIWGRSPSHSLRTGRLCLVNECYRDVSTGYNWESFAKRR